MRDGHAPNGKQKDRCHARGRRSRENPPPNAYPEARREEILDASQECRSLRVSRLRLASRVRPCRVGSKQRSSASSLTSHLGRPGPREADFYDIGTGRTDGSFVLNKAKEVWIWMALCSKTRQMVASALGDRSRQDVSTLVGGHSTSLPPRTWLHRLLGGRQGGDRLLSSIQPWEKKRDGRNRPCRAVE